MKKFNKREARTFVLVHSGNGDKRVFKEVTKADVSVSDVFACALNLCVSYVYPG